MPAAVTQFFTFPAAVLQAGRTYGPQVTPLVGGVFENYQVSVQRMGTWPVGDCLSIAIEYSQDGGLTWTAHAQATLAGGVLKDLAGNLVTASTFYRSMGTLQPGTDHQQVLALAVTDLFRVTVQCLQSCAAQITMGAM